MRRCPGSCSAKIVTRSLSASATWTAESNQAGASFGIAVAGAGDVNGDGYADVLVGASQFDGGQTNEGRGEVRAI